MCEFLRTKNFKDPHAIPIRKLITFYQVHVKIDHQKNCELMDMLLTIKSLEGIDPKKVNVQKEVTRILTEFTEKKDG